MRSNFLRFGKRGSESNTDKDGMDEVSDEMTIANKIHKSSPRSFLRFGKRRSDNFLRFGKRNENEVEVEVEPCTPLGHFFMICRMDIEANNRFKKARDFLRFG